MHLIRKVMLYRMCQHSMCCAPRVDINVTASEARYVMVLGTCGLRTVVALDWYSGAASLLQHSSIGFASKHGPQCLNEMSYIVGLSQPFDITGGEGALTIFKEVAYLNVCAICNELELISV